MWKFFLFTMWFQDFVTVFNQSYNCQTSHCLGRNRPPNARLSILLFDPWMYGLSVIASDTPSTTIKLLIRLCYKIDTSSLRNLYKMTLVGETADWKQISLINQRQPNVSFPFLCLFVREARDPPSYGHYGQFCLLLAIEKAKIDWNRKN